MSSIYNHQWSNGFTLLEVLISFSMLSVGIISVVTLLLATTKANTQTINQLVATSLMDEAFNVVRIMRDNNVLKLDPWDDGILSACGTNCIVGYPSGCFTGCGFNGTCTGQPQLIQDDPPSFISIRRQVDLGYTQNIIGCGIETDYTRTVKVTNTNSNPEGHTVEVTVSWTDKVGSHTINDTAQIYEIQ